MWAGRYCLQLTLFRGTAKGQSRDRGAVEQVSADPDPRLDIPSCWVPAHLFSSAHGRWCWGQRWGLPPGCSGTCNRPPRPGMSSTRWPPLQREGTWLQSHQDQEKLGEPPHIHTHTRSRAHGRHTTCVCTQLHFSRYLSSALPPSGSGGGTCCSSLSCCLFPKPGSERSPGCSRTQPGSPGQKGKVGQSGDSPQGAREDITSERQSWRGNVVSLPWCQGKVKKRNSREQAANEAGSKISSTNSLHLGSN